MEVEINKEILRYREAIFFGLPARELIAVIISAICSVAVYFLTGNTVLCVLAAAVPALLGFITYNGMSGLQLAKVFVADNFRAKHLHASTSQTFEILESIKKYKTKEVGTYEHCEEDIEEPRDAGEGAA